MLTLQQAKNNFFDRKKVIRAVDAATRKALSKVGAFIMRRARTSIRPVGDDLAPSKPGDPPKSRTGLLRGGILFGYEPTEKSVYIGPIALNSKVDGSIPRVLEMGGTVEVSRLARGGRRTGKRYKKRVRIAARPYMGPALQAEIAAGTIPEQFRDSVRGVE
jgi:hypothetical protein